MKRAVLFDMDGVIVDSEVIYHRSLEAYLQQLGIRISKEEMTQFAGMTIQKITDCLISRFCLDLSKEELMEGQKKVYIEFFENEKKLEVMDGLYDFLKELRMDGFLTGLASSSSPEAVKMVIERFGLYDYFNEIVSGEMVAASKPEPDIFLYTAEKIGVPAENCIVIEDSVNGIQAGKAAGMIVVGYKGSSLEQDTTSADYQLKSYRDILNFRWKKFFLSGQHPK